jgi:sodium-dependent phosphate cotransporter
LLCAIGGHIFVGSGLPGAALSDEAVGGILLVGSLLALIVCLIVMVKVLSSLLRGPMARIVRKTINADFPGYFAFLTGYFVMIIGAGVTVLVQSSSVFTSALTPLVGIGVVTVERIYPMTLGSNIGTTVTSILAALTADANKIKDTLQISLCHLFFNITGIVIWYPIPFLRRIPIGLAKGLGNITANYRWFSIFYLIALYLLIPLIVFGLSIAGFWVLMGVLIPILVLVIVIVIINILQSKRPRWLPAVLRNWNFLPLPLHSLQPYDDVLTICFKSAFYQKVCRCCKQTSTSVEPVDYKESSFSRNVSEVDVAQVVAGDDVVKEKPADDVEVVAFTTFGSEGHTNVAYENDDVESSAAVVPSE